MLLKTKAPQTVPVRLSFGAVAGRSADDFYVLGYSDEYDADLRIDHAEHEQSTFIVRFGGGRRQIVAHLPQRIDDLWMSTSGQVFGVGEPQGVLNIESAVVTETAIANLPGSFSSIWGTSEDHVFACGNYDPFWLYRRFGTWHTLPLPAGVDGLWCTAGIREDDVYAVSFVGEILHFDGHHVRRLDSPTTRWLTSAAALPDGRMCLGGHEGTLLYGDRTGWRSVDSGTDEPLLNLVSAAGGVCYVTPEGLWCFDGTGSSRQLSARGAHWVGRAGDALLLADADDACLFVGGTIVPLDTTL